MNLLKIRTDINNIGYICLGIFLACLGIKGFLLPNHFIDGGVTGTSMLLSNIFNISLAIVIIGINIPFVLLSVQKISTYFAIKSSLAIIGLSICIHYIKIPVITQDNLLCALFGGIALGSGIGFALRGGAVLDGTEIAAILISKKCHLKIGDTILIFNTILFSVGSYLLGINTALYSILTYIAASKTIDFLVYNSYELGVTIISNKSKEIEHIVGKTLGLGLTIYSGKRGLSKQNQDIIFCVCTQLQENKLKSLIQKTDESAFITIQQLKVTYGGLVKRQQLFKNK